MKGGRVMLVMIGQKQTETRKKICPVCGSDNIGTRDAYDDERGTIIYQFLCMDCHSDWLAVGFDGDPYEIVDWQKEEEKEKRKPDCV